jgi:DNA polymerase, archaea type
LDHLGDYVSKLKEDRVDTQDLVITRRIGKTLDEYRVDTPSALALQQFETVGLTLHPGQQVAYLLRDKELTDMDKRILPAPFVAGDEDYDKKKYLEMLLKAAEEVLVTLGVDYKGLVRRCGLGR